LTEIFLVSFGAILGANTRFIILSKLEKLNLSKYYFILIINTFASFFLGLFLSLIEQFNSFFYSYQIFLFFSVGFLGSMSSFSAFVYDLFDLYLQSQLSRALKFFTISLLLGIIAFSFGFLLFIK
tara:strand:- start:534 stop:908 length:375 start_codon:yes stop_codon:yes gene_type:complete